MWMVHSGLPPEAKAILLAGAVIGCLAAYGACRLAYWAATAPFRRRRGARQPDSVMDRIILRWNHSDALTLRDILNGGIVIFGRPGSGKTSSTFAQLLRHIVVNLVCGGMILSASPGDRALVEKIFAGREKKLIVFNENSGLFFNALDFVIKAGGSPKDVLLAIESVYASVSHGAGNANGGENAFFTDSARRLLYFSVIVLMHATGGAAAADLAAFINTAANSPHDWENPKFHQSVHAKMMALADGKDKSPVEQFDFEAAWAYFSRELPQITDKTRASIVVTAMNFLHPFISGLNRLLFSTQTNISPKVMDQGWWVFVDMPISRCGEEGAFALGIWKFMTQWHVLRRDSSKPNLPLFVAVDEIQRTVNEHDALFLAECRKYSSCMIACTQSMASFYANMGGQAAEAKVAALLNNFSHKAFHALGDSQTAEWASALCGTELKIKIGGSETDAGDPVSRMTGMGDWNVNINEQEEPCVKPHEFMQGLRTGSAVHGNVCDAVLVRSGALFESNDRGFIFLAMPQL